MPHSHSTLQLKLHAMSPTQPCHAIATGSLDHPLPRYNVLISHSHARACLTLTLALTLTINCTCPQYQAHFLTSDESYVGRV